jgi:hypothetical protein
MKTALSLFGNSGIQYIVLEQSIRDTVVSNFPLLTGKIDALEHPISSGQAELAATDLEGPLRFGFLGLADKAKGFPVFVELAEHITASYGRRAEFHAVGHSPSNGVTLNGTNALATQPQKTLMSREMFLSRIAPLHFIVLPHEPRSYQLTASGVLLDAIAWQKPVIARKIPLFESMFKKYGDIGYLFSDEIELKKIVEQIVLATDKSRYLRQMLHLRNARKARDPEALAEPYREICAKSGLTPQQ